MELETALLILPPPEVQAFAHPIRARYDPKASIQVPAHITLLYPFAPPEELETTLDRLAQVANECTSFDLTLDRYGQFEGVCFLEPSDPEPIRNLHRRLAEFFPEYPIYKGEHGDELHPHMTLARYESIEEMQRIELPPVPSFTFRIRRLHLYLGSENDNVPFIPLAVIRLRRRS
jgi:2'-5' RNA ligase